MKNNQACSTIDAPGSVETGGIRVQSGGPTHSHAYDVKVARANETSCTLAIFRIVFSLVGIGYLGAYLRDLDFLTATHADLRPVISGFCVYALALLVLQLFGWGGRMVTTLHFLCAASFLTRNFPSVSVNEQMYLLLSFWACFMRLNGCLAIECDRSAKPPAVWPMYMLAINFGVFLLSAGQFKLADPGWINGSFLQVTVERRHVWTQVLGLVPQLKTIMALVCYAVIAVEISILPLFMIPGTRALSLVAMTLLCLGLIYPMGFGWIGAVGCCIAVALYSICPPFARHADRLVLKIHAICPDRFRNLVIPNAVHKEQSALFRIAEKATFAIATLLLAFGVACSMATSPLRVGAPNPVDSFRQNAIEPFTNKAPPWLMSLNFHTICLGPKDMFTDHQAQRIGRIYRYRMVVTTSDNRTLEPIQAFTIDGSPGRDFTAIAEVKYVQEIVFPMSKFMDAIERGKTPDNEYVNQVASILDCCARRVGSSVRQVELLGTPRPTVATLIPVKWRVYCTWTPAHGIALARKNNSVQAPRELVQLVR